ncbi:MAG: toxin-antitoxin system HicB family antitoxin [Clostridia bacterium]|nr:toxin-antitoxin system HicB family antitoxin [Clostridia bacterium]
MFKVKKPDNINKTFRMPLELVKKLEILAQEKQVSLNNLVIQCCEYALENIDTEEDKSADDPQNP